jgi:transposase
MEVTTIGLDLAKSVFQVHGVDATGQVVIRRSLRRAQMLPFFARLPSCLVGMEACGTSHYWARELIKLGHQVRLMPPAYVKPYVKRGKTDAADAEAVCEAVRRPTMRFVPVKSPEQQAALSMHRTRDLLVKQRTQLVNMIRGLLAEFGIDIPKGLERALLMARRIVDGEAPDIPMEAAKIIGTLSQQALDIHIRLREIDHDLLVWATWQRCRASAHDDPRHWASRRDGTCRIDHRATSVPLRAAVRRLVGIDATSEIERRQRAARSRQIPAQAAHCWHDLTGAPGKVQSQEVDPRLANLLARKPVRVATVAMANKTARIVWAIMARGETYRAGHWPALVA